jgi:hypothetical protein
MFINTFERGFQDALHQEPMRFREPREEYAAGYDHGRRYRAREKITELTVVCILAVVMGVVLAAWIAQGVVLAV